MYICGNILFTIGYDNSGGGMGGNRCDQTNGTVICAESNMSRESRTCRRIIRRYLRMMDIDNVQIQCNQGLCTVSCDEGCVGDNVTYLCNDSCNCTPTGDQEIMCTRGLFVLKIMIVNDIKIPL